MSRSISILLSLVLFVSITETTTAQWSIGWGLSASYSATGFTIAADSATIHTWLTNFFSASFDTATCVGLNRANQSVQGGITWYSSNTWYGPVLRWKRSGVSGAPMSSDSATRDALVNKIMLDTVGIRGETFARSFTASDTSSFRAFYRDGVEVVGGVPVSYTGALVGYSYSVTDGFGAMRETSWNNSSDPSSYPLVGFLGTEAWFVRVIYAPSRYDNQGGYDAAYVRRFLVQTAPASGGGPLAGWTTCYSIDAHSVDLTDAGTGYAAQARVSVRFRRRHPNDTL